MPGLFLKPIKRATIKNIILYVHLTFKIVQINLQEMTLKEFKTPNTNLSMFFL